MKEALKLLYNSKEDESIKKFVSDLDNEIIEIYNKLLIPKDNEFLKTVLDPIRNNLFHYDTHYFNKDYSNMDDFYTRITWLGSKHKDLDYVFADEVSLNISFGNITEDQLRERINAVTEYIKAFNTFCNHVVSKYIYIKNHRMLRIKHR